MPEICCCSTSLSSDLHQEHGLEKIRDMIVDDIRASQARNDKKHVLTLLHVLHQFLRTHPQVRPQHSRSTAIHDGRLDEIIGSDGRLRPRVRSALSAFTNGQLGQATVYAAVAMPHNGGKDAIHSARQNNGSTLCHCDRRKAPRNNRSSYGRSRCPSPSRVHDFPRSERLA